MTCIIQLHATCFTTTHIEGLPFASKLIKVLHDNVISFCSLLPTLSCLLNPALKIRHWEAIQQTTGAQINTSTGDLTTITTLKEKKV